MSISYTDRLVLSLHMASSCLESSHAVFYRISAIFRVWTFSQSSYPEMRPWKVYFHEVRTVHLTHKGPSSFRCLELGNPKHMPGIGGASWRISLVRRCTCRTPSDYFILPVLAPRRHHPLSFLIHRPSTQTDYCILASSNPAYPRHYCQDGMFTRLGIPHNPRQMEPCRQTRS